MSSFTLTDYYKIADTLLKKRFKGHPPEMKQERCRGSIRAVVKSEYKFEHLALNIGNDPIDYVIIRN